MPGTNAGTGQPMYFHCPRWRKCHWDSRSRGDPHQVELTGRTKPRKTRTKGRMTNTMREYRCKTCGFVGWSAHRDLALRAVR